MSVTPLEQFWSIRLEAVRKRLEQNDFSASVVKNLEEAADLVMGTVLTNTAATSVAFGGSVTVKSSGLVERLKATHDLHIFDTYNTTLSKEEQLELRRQALLCDLFITSTNALTADGRLVNLDGTGNRVASISFGPKYVAVLVGRNKICNGIHEAFKRVRTIASPPNAMRLNRKTPCAITGECSDCSSPERICNTWTIHAKSSPKKRVHVILINEDLGF